MFSFFKQSVPVEQYCQIRLNSIFGDEQTGMWTRLKTNSSDTALSRVDQTVYLNEMRGAHLQLLSMAINKQYRNIEMAMEIASCIGSFLAASGSPELKDVEHQYNKAFGSSTADGVLQMARLFSTRVANNALSQQTVAEISQLFYSELSSIFADFKKYKIVAS